MRQRCNVFLSVVSAGIALLVVGCAEEAPHVRPLPGKTARAMASPTPDSDHAAALDAYRAMWRDLTIASETSDAASPLLDDHADDGALQLMKYGLKKSAEEGVVSRGAPRVHPEVVSATSEKVVLVDCVDDREWLLYEANGELKDDVPGGHLKTDATVRRAKGTWKVTDLYMHETGSC